MRSRYLPIGVALLGMLLIAPACSFAPRTSVLSAPQTATPGRPSRPDTILPAVAPDLAAAPSPTATRPSASPTVHVRSSATARPAVAATPPAQPPASTPTAALPRPTTPAQPPTSTPTADPRLFIIREEDIGRAIATGIGEEQGLIAQGLQVRFRDGRITVSADELRFGPIQVKQLVMTGRLAARDGQLQYESETISPRGLVTTLLPALANQALAQYASQWYVEEVQARDGRLIVRIR